MAKTFLSRRQINFRSSSLPLSSPPSSRVTTDGSLRSSHGPASDSRCFVAPLPASADASAAPHFGWLRSQLSPRRSSGFSTTPSASATGFFLRAGRTQLTPSNSAPPRRARRRCIPAGIAPGLRYSITSKSLSWIPSQPLLREISGATSSSPSPHSVRVRQMAHRKIRSSPPRRCVDASSLAPRSLLRVVRCLRLSPNLFPQLVALHLVQHALRN